MKKSYVECPYGKCGELTISGMKMHVKKAHPEKFEEFEKSFEELKKKAVVRESGTKQSAGSGEPPKVEPPKPPEAAPPKEPPKESPKKDEKKDGDKKSEKDGGFLDGVHRWLTEEDEDGEF